MTANHPEGSDGLALEAWEQGLMVGSLIVMRNQKEKDESVSDA
jgi:hypothetical protein